MVMTIQPPWFPLVRCRTTLATTPSPRMTRIIVPTSSATNACIETSFGREGGTLAERVVAGPENTTTPPPVSPETASSEGVSMRARLSEAATSTPS